MLVTTNRRRFVASELNSLTGVTSYEYDKNGNVTKVIDARDNSRSYEYDGLERIISETDAQRFFTLHCQNIKGYSTTFEYDAVGRISETNAHGDTFHFTAKYRRGRCRGLRAKPRPIKRLS